jgi:hypothetical protein
VLANLISENTVISGTDKEPKINFDNPVDYTLTISSILATLAPDRIISTVGYNNEISGQIIRLKEGKQVTIDKYIGTDNFCPIRSMVRLKKERPMFLLAANE